MSLITSVLASVVALEHLYILYLETFATQSDATSRVFGMEKEELQRPSVSALFKNQGVYNGLLALFLFYGIVTGNREIVTIFVLFIIGAASYGAVSSSPKILLTQGGPAILTFISLLLFK